MKQINNNALKITELPTNYQEKIDLISYCLGKSFTEAIDKIWFMVAFSDGIGRLRTALEYENIENIKHITNDAVIVLYRKKYYLISGNKVMFILLSNVRGISLDMDFETENLKQYRKNFLNKLNETDISE